MSWALQMEYVDGSLIVEYVMEDYANFNNSSETKVIDFTKTSEGWQQYLYLQAAQEKLTQIYRQEQKAK